MPIPKDYFNFFSKSSLVPKILCTFALEFSQKGFSSVQPFCIGKVETRMMQFAQINAVTLASDDLYMSAKQLQHCMRLK